MNDFNIEEEDLQNNKTSRSNKSLRDVYLDYISYWKLFIFLIFAAVIGSILYIRLSLPVFQTNAKILITNNEKKNTGQSEFSAFEDLEIFNNFNSVDNEKAILTSRKLISKVVDELSLNVEYFTRGRYTGFRQSELYLKRPFSLHLIDSSSKVNFNFIVKLKNEKEFDFLDENGNRLKSWEFNKSITLFGRKFLLKEIKENIQSFISREIKVIVKSNEGAIQKVLSNLSVEQENKSSTVLNISLNTNSYDKGIVIVDKLIQLYNLDAINDKKIVSENTKNFISERIEILNEELDSIEHLILDFKKSKNIIDLDKEIENDLIFKSNLTSKIIDASSRNEVRKIMLQNINKSIKEDLVIDINLGAVDLNIDQAIIKHNELIFKRIELLKNLTPENDKIISLENQLKEIQNNLIKSLQNTIQATEEELSELIENEKKVTGRMSLAPVKYKNYWELSRQQKIKESLFLYLLEKLEETQIALAAKIGNAKIINYPHSSKNPISPNKYIVYISFISASIFFYICIIYVKNLFRDKVYSKSDIDNAGLPYVGNIPLGQKNSEIVISKGVKSAIAESFRGLRTNVDFLLGSKQKEKGNFIFITSSVAKEGKSFTAVNFSLSLALSGKKVLLLGMDLRAPKLEDYMGNDRSRGVTNYIVDSKTNYRLHLYH